MAEPRISFIVTCKGRLAYLRQTLPGLMAQSDAEVIVVDYDCPDGAGAWVEKEWPAAKVARVVNAPFFSAPRARNMGARGARGQWLCFTDADNLLGGDYARHLGDSLQPGAYFWDADAPGHVLCARADFQAIAGYDEVLEGWGQEDMDLVLRLDLLGRAKRDLPAGFVTTIAHSNEERVRYQRQKNPLVSNTINALYFQVKRDLMQEAGLPGMGRELRQNLYDKARIAVMQVVRDGKPSGAMTVTIYKHRVRLQRGWKIERAWNYVLTPPKGSGKAPKS